MFLPLIRGIAGIVFRRDCCPLTVGYHCHPRVHPQDLLLHVPLAPSCTLSTVTDSDDTRAASCSCSEIVANRG